MDRKPQILFVSGDLGGAKIQLPVYRELEKLGILPLVVTDASPSGRASDVWNKNDITSVPMLPAQGLEDLIRQADLIFAGSCATTYAVEKFAIECGNRFNKFTVIGSDADLNHDYPHWRGALPDLWLANSKLHQADILSRRPDWLEDRVPVFGQPAYDELVELMETRENIREEMRKKLGIQDEETVMLYWSPGSPKDFCTAGFKGLLAGISQLPHCCINPVLIPRLHPKIETVIGKDYDQSWRKKIQESCEQNNVRIVNADGLDANKLNLAAEVVMTQWSGQGVTSAIMNVPTVNVLLPEHQRYLEETLKQLHPFVAPLKYGVALGAFSEQEVKSTIFKIFNPDVQSTLRENAKQMMPSGDSAKSIAEFLKNLLS